MRDCSLTAALALLLVAAPVAHAGAAHAGLAPTDTIYVDADATGTGDGSSWADAYTKLQDALQAARTNGQDDAVWVAAGTYYPDEGGSATDDDRTTSFEITSGIDLRGHFSGDEDSPEDRALGREAPKTILSGEIQQDANMTNNAYTVLHQTGGTVGEVHITRGTANGADGRGGGVRISGGTLHHAVLKNNRARRGAALSATGSPTLEVLLVTGNHATQAGALYFDGDATSAQHLTVADNTAEEGLNGFCFIDSDATVNDFAMGPNTTNGVVTVTYTVEGTLTDEDGDQLSNKDILIQTTGDNTVATTTTDANGDYSVSVTEDDLGGDTGEVESNPTGYNKVETEKTFSEGSNTVDLSLPLTEWTRTYDVDDASNNPVANASIDADETTNGRRDVFTASTNSSGEHTEVLTIDDDIISGDNLEYTINKDGYTSTTKTETLTDTTKTIDAVLDEETVDRITVTFNPKIVGDDLYSGGYDDTFNYEVSTDDTTFTTSGSTTADVPISDGDQLDITHTDAAYLNTVAVNNTDTEPAPFNVSGFPDEPDYQGTTVSIDKSDVVSEYQVAAFPGTSPDGHNTSDEYVPHINNSKRFTDQVVDGETLDQDKIYIVEHSTDWDDKATTAVSNVRSTLPFPTSNPVMVESHDALVDSAATRDNYNFTSLEEGSNNNNGFYDGDYLKFSRSWASESTNLKTTMSEFYSAITDFGEYNGQDIKDTIFDGSDLDQQEAAFPIRILYNTTSGSSIE